MFHYLQDMILAEIVRDTPSTWVIDFDQHGSIEPTAYHDDMQVDSTPCAPQENLEVLETQKGLEGSDSLLSASICARWFDTSSVYRYLSISHAQNWTMNLLHLMISFVTNKVGKVGKVRTSVHIWHVNCAD